MKRLEELIPILIQAENKKLEACDYPVFLEHTIDQRNCAKWIKFIHLFNEQRQSTSKPTSKPSCPVSGEPCYASSHTKLSFVVSLSRKGSQQSMLSVIYVSISQLNPKELIATLDSCTLRQQEGKGLNKLLRTIICHLLVTQLHCVWLYNFTSNPASEHLVTKYFKWQKSHDEDLHNRIAHVSQGDLVEFIGDYRSPSSPAYMALVALYRSLCALSSTTVTASAVSPKRRRLA